MQLNEFHENNKAKLATRALKEHYNISYDLGKLNVGQTRSMLTKVRGLLSEARAGKKLHESHKNPAYLKLIMMEQMLATHYSQIRISPYNIIVENEEVEKSEVILAAQDMVDTVQDMIEKVSKMNVEQLSAMTDSINSEFGVNESEQFSSSVGEALTTLLQALQQAKTGLRGALGTLTGADGGAEAGDEFGAEPGADLGGDLGGEPEADLGGDLGGEEPGADLGGDLGGEELPTEEPEEPAGPAGRERR